MIALDMLRLDARKIAVKTKTGLAKIPGKECGRGYISAAYKCGEHYTNGKLNESGKAAAVKLSGKVKALKGMTAAPVKAPKPVVVDTRAKMGVADAFDIHNRIKSGDISASEVKQRWEQFKNNKESIREELNKRTIKELKSDFHSFHAKKKDEWVNVGMKGIEASFIPPNTNRTVEVDLSMFSSRRSPEDIAKAKKRKADEADAAVNSWTDAGIQSAAAERKAKTAAFKKAVTEPETVDEFRTFLQYRKKESMTADQQRRYEALVTDKNREMATAIATKKVEKAISSSGTATYSVEKHSKTGADLHTVKMADRVDKETFNAQRDQAKALGGYYSRYSKAFVLPDEAKAKEFQQQLSPKKDVAKEDIKKEATSLVETQGTTRRAAAAEKIQAVAERTKERAEETLSADRKMNTARRARMGTNIMERAERDKRLAETMVRVAERIDKGDVKYLDKLSSKSEFEALEGSLFRARILQPRAAEAKAIAESKRSPVTEADYERFKGQTGWLLPDAKKQKVIELRAGLAGRKAYDEAKKKGIEDEENKKEVAVSFIDHAELPSVGMSKSDALRMIEAAKGVRGAASAGRELQSLTLATRKDYIDIPERKIEAIRSLTTAIAKKDPKNYDATRVLDQLSERDRFSRMGINSNEELRTVLREYYPLRTAKSEETPERKAKRMEIALLGRKVGVDYFPTPIPLANRVVAEADISPGMKVLEPSAGSGRIADAMKRAGASNIVTIEPSNQLREILDVKGYKAEDANFLNFSDGKGSYDRIVMNPPFSGGADVDHVLHAYDLLKPGGKMVAIMSEGSFFRQSKKDEAFREFLDSVGYSEKLPESSFKESGTGVNTRMVTIDKPDVSLSQKKSALAAKGISTSGMSEEQIANRFYAL